MNSQMVAMLARMALMVVGGMLVQRGKLDPTTFETISGALTVVLGGGPAVLDTLKKPVVPAA